MKGTLKEDIDKFSWTDAGRHWGAFRVTVDISAEDVLAELFVLDTYERSNTHVALNGSLPRFIKKDVNGSRRYVLMSQSII